MEKLGEGGMGEVWLAQQTEPVKRKVAPEASLFSLAYFEAVERGNRAKAINWLRQAVDAGAVADWLSDPDLESLHGSEFDALVERARRNAETQRAK